MTVPPSDEVMFRMTDEEALAAMKEWTPEQQLAFAERRLAYWQAEVERLR